MHADKLDRIIDAVLTVLIQNDKVEQLADTMSRMKAFEQRKYLNAIIVFMIRQYFSIDVVSKDDTPLASSRTISGAASLIDTLTKDNDALKEHLGSVLTRSTIPTLDDSLSARRSVMATLAKDDGWCTRLPFGID
jgi:telomere length regulation protein